MFSFRFILGLKKILQVPFADRNENGPAFSNNYD